MNKILHPGEDRKIKKSDREWEIKDGTYKHLIYFDEPILFTGINPNNQKIIGSSIDYFYTENINAYFHAVVSNFNYKAFMNGEISLARIYERAHRLFVVHYTDDHSGEEPMLTVVYQVKWEDIPEEYRPTKDSFFIFNSPKTKTVEQGNEQLKLARQQRDAA